MGCSKNFTKLETEIDSVNSEREKIMFGRSVYLSDLESDFFDIEENVDIYFTSLHIMEEFTEDYGKRAKNLLESLKRAGKKVMVDISSRGLQALGYDSLEQFFHAPHCRKSCFMFSEAGGYKRNIYHSSAFRPHKRPWNAD